MNSSVVVEIISHWNGKSGPNIIDALFALALPRPAHLRLFGAQERRVEGEHNMAEVEEHKQEQGTGKGPLTVWTRLSPWLRGWVMS